ncbi:MAG: hypothetical protein ACKPHU_10465, partial [Planctomycetaceae bacterium]
GIGVEVVPFQAAAAGADGSFVPVRLTLAAGLSVGSIGPAHLNSANLTSFMGNGQSPATTTPTNTPAAAPAAAAGSAGSAPGGGGGGGGGGGLGLLLGGAALGGLAGGIILEGDPASPDN